MVDATLVTVHGFWSSQSTWDRLSTVWQTDEELEGLRIHGFGYASPMKPRLPWSRTRIPDFDDVAQMLATEYTTVLGKVPVIAFVTHSQGGLILQRFLAWMVSEGRARELDRIKTIVTLACPNGGSQYLDSVRRLLGYGRHPQAAELEVLSKKVTDTQRTVMARIVNAHGVDDHQCQIPFHAYAGGSDAIVPAASAQAAFPRAGTLAGDHSTILDPFAPGSRTADAVKHHILEDLAKRPPVAGRTAESTVPAGAAEQHGESLPSFSGAQGVQVGDGNLQLNVYYPPPVTGDTTVKRGTEAQAGTSGAAEKALSPEWQKHRVDEAIAKAGRRYTPRVHVEVEAGRALDAIGRTGSWLLEWRRSLADLRVTRRWPWRPPEQAPDAFAAALPRCAAALDAADAVLAQMIAAAGSAGELLDAEGPLKAAQVTLAEIDALLHRHAMTDDRYFTGDAGALYSSARRASEAIGDGLALARSPVTRAATEKVLLLTGRAGVGKTHLLCDAARRRIEEGRPTILLLGQDFDGRSLLGQVAELSQLGPTLDDLLAVLDAASQAAGCTGLLMIDALNESERPDRWPGDIRALVAACRRYPHVALVLSCRSEFTGEVIGDEKLPRVEHFGFAEATDAAIMRFTEEYGLEPPTFPALNPEFSNPLYLKLTCEALLTLGESRFRFGAAGLTTVTSAFIEAVNQRLSEAGRCNYDKWSDLAGACVRRLADLGHGPWSRADVQRVAEELLPGRDWSRSLLKGLIAEGVLIESQGGRIAFGYQRLGDIARASVIAEKDPDGIRKWLEELGDSAWAQRGVLGALAVIVPEKHGTELPDLDASPDSGVSDAVIDSFIESLLLRSPESVTPRAVALVQKLLAIDYQVSGIWERLVRIACVPGHPLNAEFLHEYLAAFGLADRDATWSTWLTGATEAGGDPAVRRLIDWAWPADLASRLSVPDDVAVLAVQLLGWLLTTTDRRVRDRATKAIVSIGERAPAALAQALTRFRGVDDPYVIERLAAAACGVVLRNDSASAATLIADAVSTLTSDDWPLHLLTRDYARRVFTAAGARGWPGPQPCPPHGAKWPVEAGSAEEIEQLAAPPEYAYSSIWHSLSGMGDFGRYILQSSLHEVDSPDPKALLHDAERTIFDRVLDLGWTPERFKAIDSRRGGRDTNPIERVGKKYQWAGFYEILGRITDNHNVRPDWGIPGPQPYQYPEQLIYRDIDPTVLARRTTPPPFGRPWFSPAEARFPEGIVTDYPDDMTAIPDPLDLIAIRDPHGVPWLALASHPVWEQQIPPETEALGIPRREAWMHITAYLVPVTTTPALRDWAQGKDWFGRWMPEAPDIHNALLGAYPQDPQWAAADGAITHWDTHRGGPMPQGLTLTSAHYSGTGTSRDASAAAETTGWAPSRHLHDVLGVTHEADFTWSDASGTALHDPSATSGGPATLAMRRDLLPRLASAGLTLFWTVLIGNELQNTNPLSHPGDEYRWVSASASYLLGDETVSLIDAAATLRSPAQKTDRQLIWTPRRADK